MDEENSNRRYNYCNLKRRKKKISMECDEVATDYKLQQFLEDVQKFAERSKKTRKKKNLQRKAVDLSKQVYSKRGLFENGLRSKPCLKGIVGLENRARLKGNLNDLVRECSQSVEDEMEMTSSSDQSSFEGSYVLQDQEVNNNIESEEHKYGKDTIKNNERLNASDVRSETHYPHTIVKKDQNQSKELMWKKYCKFKEVAGSFVEDFPVVDHVKIAQQKMNTMIYETFLENARNYPSILKKIFSNDEIKKLAQIVVNDKVDKSEQTEDLSDCGLPANNYILEETSIKKDNIFPFTPSPEPYKSSNNQDEEASFFELNQSKKINSQKNFVNILENQPDIFSPMVQNGCSDPNVTPPPSPLTPIIQQCWAPSTDSTPRMPEILTPIKPQPQSSSLFQCDRLFLQKKEYPVVNKQKKPNLALRSMRRKVAAPSQFKHRLISDSPLQMHFPKRKRVTFSPHRL